MKQYIKLLTIGIGAGAAATLLIEMAVRRWLDNAPRIGGEFFLPVLLGLVGYIGWDLANAYFYAVRYKEIYKKGFDSGAKIHTYSIVIPTEEDDERKESS